MRTTSPLILCRVDPPCFPGLNFRPRLSSERGSSAGRFRHPDTERYVTIVFTGAIEPRFSTIRVTDERAQRVDDSQPIRSREIPDASPSDYAAFRPGHMSSRVRDFNYTDRW